MTSLSLRAQRSNPGLNARLSQNRLTEPEPYLVYKINSWLRLLGKHFRIKNI